MAEKKLSQSDQRLMNARIQAAVKLQHLAFDAANRTPGSFMNRDRAMDVVDAITSCVLETLNLYLEENKNAAASSK